jgi:hypothetical protein
VKTAAGEQCRTDQDKGGDLGGRRDRPEPLSSRNPVPREIGVIGPFPR